MEYIVKMCLSVHVSSESLQLKIISCAHCNRDVRIAWYETAAAKTNSDNGDDVDNNDSNDNSNTNSITNVDNSSNNNTRFTSDDSTQRLLTEVINDTTIQLLHDNKHNSQMLETGTLAHYVIYMHVHWLVLTIFIFLFFASIHNHLSSSCTNF